MWDCARRECGGGIYIGNNDHCNLNFNLTLNEFYSDNVWAIFNEIYDVQTGVNISQQVHCGGYIGCCPNARLDDSDVLCCSEDEQEPTCSYNGPDYRASNIYVVGNVLHHILPFCTYPTSAPPLTEPPFCGAQFCQAPYCDPVPPCDPQLPCCDASLCIEPGAFGQAVFVGPQAQVRVVNNTMYKCAQGLHILCMHNSGNPHECPPYGEPLDGENGKEGVRRNTLVTMVNNVILDTPNDGNNDTHVRVCTGPYGPEDPDDELPATLNTNGPTGIPGFDHNLHYGTYRTFQIPSGPWASILELRNDPLVRYGRHSEGDDTGANGGPDDNPRLVDPAKLLFDLTSNSPPFMSTNGIKDAAYDTFVEEFPAFPNIYRDYDDKPYSGTTCAVGAFKD